MGRRRRYVNANSAKEVADRMLSTLEERRDQITNRATVCLAATSGLMVLAIQLIFVICDMNDFMDYRYINYTLIICVTVCAWAIITSVDLIKKISRDKHMGKNQNVANPNIFYFGWIKTLEEAQLDVILEKMTWEKQIRFEVRQAISLSNNLDYRYKQLSRTYKLFVTSMCIYTVTVIAFVVIKYDIIETVLIYFRISFWGLS